MNNIKKKKILITDYTVTKKILSNSSLLTLLDSKEGKKFEFCIVFNTDCDVNKELKLRGYKTYICPYGGLSLIKSLFQHLILPFAYFYIILREKPDFIYANNVMASKSGALLKYMSLKPLIVHIRNVGFFKRTRFYSLLADRFLCVSQYCKNNTLPRSYHHKAKVVYDGIDANKFVNKSIFYKDFNKLDGQIVIGMVGRISEQKGQDFFVRAANDLIKKYPNLIFLHCGEEPDLIEGIYAHNLKKNTKKMVSDKKFYWFNYTDNIEDFWSVVDIAVVPSKSDEAFGRVIIEAMSSGIPVVTTLSGGPEEIIQHNINGICVSKDEYPELLNGIIKLINNTNLREIFIKNSKKIVEAQFSSEVYSRNVLDAIKKI